MFWSILGWVLLSLLALLVLVLVLPAVLTIDYRDGALHVYVRVLFIKLRLYPFPERLQRKTAKEKGGEAKEEKPKKERRKRSFEEMLHLVKRLASSASRAMRWVLKGLWVYGVEVVVPVSAADAADVALRCGRVQALMGGARAVLANVLRIRYKRLVVLPDFAGQFGDAWTFACKIAAPPVIMLIAGLAGLKRFVTYPRLRRTKPNPQKPTGEPGAAS